MQYYPKTGYTEYAQVIEKIEKPIQAHFVVF